MECILYYCALRRAVVEIHIYITNKNMHIMNLSSKILDSTRLCGLEASIRVKVIGLECNPQMSLSWHKSLKESGGQLCCHCTRGKIHLC